MWSVSAFNCASPATSVAPACTATRNTLNDPRKPHLRASFLKRQHRASRLRWARIPPTLQTAAATPYFIP